MQKSFNSEITQLAILTVTLMICAGVYLLRPDAKDLFMIALGGTLSFLNPARGKSGAPDVASIAADNIKQIDISK